MKLTMRLGERSYDIIIKAGALNHVGELTNLRRRALVVTADGVPPQYAQTVAAQCSEASIVTVKQEGIQSEEDLNKAVNRAGYAYNKAKKAYLRTQSRIEKLQPLLRAFDDWEDTSPTVSIVQKMEDGPEKKALMEQYSDLFDRYNAARRVMYGFKTRLEQIEETRARVQSMRDSLPGLEEKLDAAKEELRRMKRTQYAYRLSHSSAYLAGQEAEPIRGPKQEYAREQTRTTTRTQSRDEGR